MSQITFEHNIDSIEGLTLIVPTLHHDIRGWFMESFKKQEFDEAVPNVQFVQDNQSLSHRGVLRGMHFQTLHPQGKLIRCLYGAFYDVAVDLRRGSRTFGKWHGEFLSAENMHQLFVPAGFAQGFLALEDNTMFFAKVTDYQYKGEGSGVAWNDPDIGIEWPVKMLNGTGIILSDADRNKKTLKELIENEELPHFQ